ncbi:MAG: MauE/DoxX family redox-associated membrane protein [Pseudomonadales bacterium]
MIVLVARLALAWLFLAGALHKLRNSGAFIRTLASYALLPGTFLPAAAWLVMLAELAVGLGALLQLRPSYVAALTLLLVYAIAMGVNLARGRSLIDCGCGAGDQPISVALIVRNCVLAVGAGFAATATAARPSDWIDLLAVAAGVLCCGLAYAAINALLAERARLDEWV